MLIKWETKTKIWSITNVRFKWIPEITGDSGDMWSFWWLWFSIEWLSKEWLEYCERKGFTLSDALDFVEREIREND